MLMTPVTIAAALSIAMFHKVSDLWLMLCLAVSDLWLMLCFAKSALSLYFVFQCAMQMCAFSYVTI